MSPIMVLRLFSIPGSYKRKDKVQKYSYSNDRRVLVAGFGSALVLIGLFLLLMSWLSEQVHLTEFCLGRFSR
jgi:hypothetical protein